MSKEMDLNKKIIDRLNSEKSYPNLAEAMGSYIKEQMKTPDQFKEGDLVQLKSGGPIMTVISVDLGRSCRCAWFPLISANPVIYSKETSREHFNQSSLVKK